MPDHIQIRFPGLQPEQQEILVAQLAEMGFESFEETETELNAFIPAPDFDESLLRGLAYKYQLEFSSELIPEQNWNAIWESQFSPVVIGDFVAIRADFHPPITSVTHEIIITPKMSFGTGHHATTRMMLRSMRGQDFYRKKVLDLGTGTGILAILAEKLGAAKVVAADIDPWSIANAAENIQNNNCRAVQLVDAEGWTGHSFDIVLANINRSVILANLHAIASSLIPQGILQLSGMLQPDWEEVRREAGQYRLQPVDESEEEGWICAALKKNS